MAAEVKADKVTPPSGSLELVGNVLGSALATALQAQDWTTANKLLTPARLADAFKGANQSLAAAGYQKLPGGLIIQWGKTTMSVASGTGASATITLPVAFPNAGLSASVTPNYTATLNGGYIPFANFTSASQLLVGLDDSQTSASTGNITVFWLAIGY